MTDAPKRIWADIDDEAFSPTKEHPSLIPYLRADIADELVAELVEALGNVSADLHLPETASVQNARSLYAKYKE